MQRMNTPRRPKRDREYDDFRETLAAPAPRTYRQGPDAVPTDPAYTEPTALEQVVRVVAGILSALLAIRFVTALFSTDGDNAFVNTIFSATNWLVRPFQAVLGTPPSGGGGYLDLPALAAIAIVSLLAWAIGSLVRNYE